MNKKEPKLRKHPTLWQAYLWWDEITRMHLRHKLRLNAIERGASQMDAEFEQLIIELTDLKNVEIAATKEMIKIGKEFGPLWDWVIGHKGIAGSLGAQLLAQIDDIENSPTIASLWRFAGLAVFDGQAEKKNEHTNRKLKGICFKIADQFIRHYTPHYRDIYEAEKFRQRELHPEPWCIDCDQMAELYQKKDKGELVPACRCPAHKKKHKIRYSNAHLHNRAWRKMMKEFLKNLWLEWRRVEGLPISESY